MKTEQIKNISSDHKNSKNPDYWNDLISGTTSQYKEAVMAKLIAEHFKKQADVLVDIGCGTCETILKYGKQLKAQKLICIDYDAKIIEQMKTLHHDKPIEFRVADIFDLSSFKERIDLVFFMDMLHEIYSFYGRPDKNLQTPVDHSLGQKYVKQAVANIAEKIAPLGGIIITDNVLCEENVDVTVRLKRPEIVETIKYFFENYTTRKFNFRWESKDQIVMNSRDFCILLTQYNKIKNKNWVRWGTERYEIHQYMTLSEYHQMFQDLGFKLHAVVSTPLETAREWDEDFQMLAGFKKIPEKRITLLAVKEKP